MVEPAGPSSPESTTTQATAAAPPRITGVGSPPTERADAGSAGRPAAAHPGANGRPVTSRADPPLNGAEHLVPVEAVPLAASARPPSAGPAGGPVNGERSSQCTAPQLRRFIKSRPYVPMHELRRRFSINGDDDDVTPVRIDPGWIFVGLPSHEGHLLGDLLRTGEIGYELSLDPRTPIVVGVYPMRPIPRN